MRSCRFLQFRMVAQNLPQPPLVHPKRPCRLSPCATPQSAPYQTSCCLVQDMLRRALERCNDGFWLGAASNVI